MNFEELVSNVTQVAFKMMRERPLDAIYLYYSPGRSKVWGGLFVFYQAKAIPLGYELATNGRVPRAMALPELREWIRERARVLPLLPVEVIKS